MLPPWEGQPGPARNLDPRLRAQLAARPGPTPVQGWGSSGRTIMDQEEPTASPGRREPGGVAGGGVSGRRGCFSALRGGNPRLGDGAVSLRHQAWKSGPCHGLLLAPCGSSLHAWPGRWTHTSLSYHKGPVQVEAGSWGTGGAAGGLQGREHHEQPRPEQRPGSQGFCLILGPAQALLSLSASWETPGCQEAAFRPVLTQGGTW